MPVPQEIQATLEEERALTGQNDRKFTGTDRIVHLTRIMADRDPATLLSCTPVHAVDDGRTGEKADIACIQEQAPDISFL